MKKMNVCAAMIAAILVPATAIAQESTPSLGGSAVAGVCLLSREAVFANAKAGVSASEQLQKLTRDAQAEISGEQKQLDAELQRLGLVGTNVQESKLTDQQRAAVQKLQALQKKAADRGRQIEATRAKALQRISEAAQPLIAQVYTRHKCGLLLDRAGVLGGNLSNDLTAEVVAALDAKVTSVPVTLEAVPAAAGN